MRSDLNEILTRVGPGTKMGELFRRFWLPALLEEEVAKPDGPPVKFRILGEDLVAFRDTEGKVGVIDAYCAHRRAGLEYGRNEECGLRCVYHGWKFSVTGELLDAPSEPPSRLDQVKKTVKITAYPTHVAGGAVWVYMGPPEAKPPFPAFEWTRFPASQSAIIKRYQPCNYAQALEGGIDSAHISFLHRDLKDLAKAGQPVANAGQPRSTHARYAGGCQYPEFSVDETDYGLRIMARRYLDDADKDYWRVTQFMLPCFQMVPPTLEKGEFIANPTYGNIWVPIDDYNTWNWGFSSDVEALSERQRIFMGKSGIWGELHDDFTAAQNLSNKFEWSQERQRSVNYSGIAGVRNQDAAVVESMGPLVDRSKENLGHSDSAIIRFRRQIIALANALADGKEPPMPHRPELFNIRSFSTLLEKDVHIREQAPLLEAGAPL
ncbi:MULTISPECIES: Rieske 2Fe-2S domain-containing protein [unclassified Beijerinckia]|uniref:Rieske 2Fe-2S domain-containing protein n=1 Tax=unclassified Beijerinckia TaxID=2638183 RepID=UPI00089A3A8A|nr:MULTISPECIES: Rieske 2Fe-2S domain-containing protein [unclassified Beijerinckia]MDH7795250.1 phthalate 4,5-dioxygenase oxygenase subunit [Beijerinckia sp. GAS462]SEB93689.1 Rieske [2Fe-2S] domain-containing protein [Beijerinckia sp. 28-YEA-48]